MAPTNGVHLPEELPDLLLHSFLDGYFALTPKSPIYDMDMRDRARRGWSELLKHIPLAIERGLIASQDETINNLHLNIKAQEDFGYEQALLIKRLSRELEEKSSDSDLLQGLREICGYVEAGEGSQLRIGQDDATRTWLMYIDDKFVAEARTFKSLIEEALGRRKAK